MSGTREWDAGTYDRVSAPQLRWGRAVVERLELKGDESVLDAGCGSGRVTELLLERLPAGRLVAVDGSEAMRTPFAEAVHEAWGPAHELDYVRLNISARRPTAAR